MVAVDWPMRTAKSDIPNSEIPLFLQVVKNKGYAYWGASNNASHCEQILIFKTGPGGSKIAHGILDVSECLSSNEINDEDFHNHRPENDICHDKSKFQKYYKVTGGRKEFIERYRIKGSDGKAIKHNIRANQMVSLD